MSPTPQTPPTDRPLTAGEPLWMVHVLGPDEIYPAPDHATAVEWCAGMNGAIPESDVLCVAVPALWTGSRQSHSAGLTDARDDFSALSRPATSAASEVTTQACVDWDDYADDIGDVISDSLEMDWTSSDGAKAVVRWLNENAPYSAALASPPVSERERELEGALDLCSAALQRLHTDIEALMADSEGVSGLHHNGDVATWGDLGHGGQFSDWLGDPLWAARNAWHDARRVLTPQPAGEGR